MTGEHTFSHNGRTWRVKDLWAAAETLPRKMVPLTDLEADRLLDSCVWSQSGAWTKALTVKEILAHASRVEAADLSYPIILTPEGRIADGTHRIVKALRLGYRRIVAVQLPTMPESIPHELPL